MTTHDVLGIGLGPFNLGLACLIDPVDEIDAVFLESRDELAWHPGMMLPDATLQVPFMADLVTMADPTSPYSFLAWLKETGRLYAFYIRESFYPLRAEYDAYCRWAAGRLDSVRLGRHVDKVTHDGGAYVVTTRLRDGSTETFRARRLVLGTGTSPHVPDQLRGLDGPVTHSADYLRRKAELQRQSSITIVGSGQSAAEIYRDLLEDIDSCGYDLTWVTRSPRFFPLEYTKLTLEMTSPEYTRYFHELPGATRDRLVGEQKGLYKGISGDVVDDIFDTLYRKRVHGDVPTRLLTCSELTDATFDGERYALRFHHGEQHRDFGLETEGLVLATGYRPVVPGFVQPIADRIRWDEQGRYDVASGYTIDHGDDEIFVQNAEEHTHGFVAPDLGMGAYRASILVNRLAGRDVYRVEDRIAFQEFGAPTDLLAQVRS